MQRFEKRALREARAFAMAGGQALHVYMALPMPNAPGCFKRARVWGHLFDQNVERLKAAARRFGVNVIMVHHEGTERQHIDLCGGPLAKALRECEEIPE